MAISLRDKLKAADAPMQTPGVCKKRGLTITDTVFPLDQFKYLSYINTETMRIMDKVRLPEDIHPERILYLDTETTGLSTGAGTVAFLVGAGFITPAGFTVRQYLMGDYCDELDLLRQISTLMNKFDMLVTFNGSSFDLPLLSVRLTMNRLQTDILEIPHMDLLHIARRVFKLRLKHCNLSFLEEAVLGIQRTEDIPGAEIPARYFRFLQTGVYDLLSDILMHNSQDIVSLLKLLSFIIYMYDHPEEVRHHEDVYSIGVALEKRRLYEQARVCYQLTSKGSTALFSLKRLAHNYRRSNELDSAVRTFEALTHSYSEIDPYIELAKLYEHRLKDIDLALNYTVRAMTLLDKLSFSNDPTVQVMKNAIQYRYNRLVRKRAKR